MQNYYMGRWHSHEDEQLVIEQGLGFGSFWDTQTYIMYCGLIYIEKGAYDKFLQMYELLLEQGENYNSSFGVSLGYRLAAIGFYKFRRFSEFILIAEDGKNFIGATGNSAISLVFHCMDLLVQIKLGNNNEAEEVLKKAKELQKQVSNMPVYHTPYLLAKVHFDLAKLQKLQPSDIEYKAIKKEISRNSKILIAKSKKMIANLPEAYLLRAGFYFVRKKYSSAFKNLQLAIAVCEKHKSRLELSRAYFEAGKFLSDPTVKYNELNGHPAGYYLEKAKTMYEEMGLEWDLEEWRRFSE